jgi:hypothetical protein
LKTDPPITQPERWPDLPVILLIGALLIAGGAVALTFGTARWIGHAVTAFTGLALMTTVILTGAVTKGRIRTKRIPHVFRFHRMASIGFGLFVIGTFALGLLTTGQGGGPPLTSGHGIIGLILVLLVTIQVIPSLVVKKRIGIQTLHRLTGYTIVPVFLLQVIAGLLTAGIL